MIYFRFWLYKQIAKVNQFLAKKFGNIRITFLNLPVNDAGFICRWHWANNDKQGVTIRIGALRVIYWKSVK